ncbi:MobA/MobL family protein [Tardiphaga sp. 803_E3_N1_3]|uniref:MobA/MobL family protein n=1 Tax=Tardiphaga sp. 803_E3_N1_3 TaxID=3240785 RepID=UPI003F296D5A
MAIYSLHHSPVGKSTQAQPYTAAAHIGYITRKNAMSQMRFERIPAATPRQMAAYLRGCEDTDRKNARVIDKLMLALPRELSSEQRAELVRGFAEDVTNGRAPWLAAFHEKGKDRQNPHCHLVLRDRDYETGKRVIGTSEVGSTERLRQKWEEHANRALQLAGCQARIDRRTLEAQGVERQPTIHEGPQSQAMDRRGARPKSKRRTLRNRPGSRSTHRSVDYRAIDGGLSRPQLNRSRRMGGYESEQDYWAAVDAHNEHREMRGRGLGQGHSPESMDSVIFFLGIPKLESLPEAGRRLGPDPIVVVRKPSSDGRIPKRPNGVDEYIDRNEEPSHEKIVRRSLRSEREIGMEDSWRRRILTQKCREAEDGHRRAQDRVFELARAAYDKGDDAVESMNRFAGEHGPEKLAAQLKKNPGRFGNLNSNQGVWQSLKAGAAQKRDTAKLAQRELPDAVRNVAKLANDSKAAKRSLADEGFLSPQPETSRKNVQARNRRKEVRAPTAEPTRAMPQQPKPQDHSELYEKSPANGEKSPHVPEKPAEKIAGRGKPLSEKPETQKGEKPDRMHAGPQEKPSFSNQLRNQQAPSNPTSINQPAPKRLQRVQPPSKEEHQQPKPDSSGIDAPSKSASKPSFSQRLREPPATPAPASKAVEKPRGKTPSHEIEM